MKPNPQQTQWLNEYLSAVLTYRETYGEIYDHIITALDKYTVHTSFEATVQQVIADEFGNVENLILLESDCKNGIVTETRIRYNRYFKWLRFPYGLMIIIAAVAAFYTFTRVTHKIYMFGLGPGFMIHFFGYFLLLPVIAVFLPFLLLAIRYFLINSKFGNGSVSARDTLFTRLVFLPFRVLIYIIIFEVAVNYLWNHVRYLPYKVLHFLMLHTPLQDIFLTQKYLLNIAFLILPFLHLFAFWKLYRSEAKFFATISNR